MNNKHRVFWRPLRNDRVVFKVHGDHPVLIVTKKNTKGLMFVCRALRINWSNFAHSIGILK